MSHSQKPGQGTVQTTKIVLTGGGSGGHITPLLPLAHALKSKNPACRLIYIGLKGEKIEIPVKRLAVFDDVARISSGKFRRYHGESWLSHLLDLKTLLLNFRDLFKVMAGSWKAYRLLGKYKPAVIFSKGGFVVVPVGIAARLRGVPLVTHDSDGAAGLANRIVGRWASVHATGLPTHYYSYPKGTTIQTGIPVDERLKPVSPDLQVKLKHQIGLPSDGLMLLIAGGGLGSRTINNLVVELSPELFKNHPKLQIVHFAGSGHQDRVAQQYLDRLGKSMPSKVRVIGFANDFYVYSGAADVVLARAGATTLAELAIQRKAALIIPSPFLTSGHQLKNAEELTTKQAAEVLPNDVTSKKLFTVLDSLLQNKQRRQQLAHNIGSLAHPNAARQLADILLLVANPK